MAVDVGKTVQLKLQNKLHIWVTMHNFRYTFYIPIIPWENYEEHAGVFTTTVDVNNILSTHNNGN